MSQVIPLSAVANQSLSVPLGDARYDLRFHDLGGMMAVDISLNDQVLVLGSRVAGNAPLIPFRYLEGDGGNFLFLTEPGAIPYWESFGTTQTLLYVTPEELAEFRND